MEALVRFLLADVPVWTLALAVIIALAQTRRQWQLGRWAEASLLWISFWVLGVAGVYGFIAHIAFGPFIAEQIGWPNSPFQNEVAYANLMMGILGFSRFALRQRAYLMASMTAYCSWFFADGIGHVVSLIVDHNSAPSNAGSPLYTDLLTPIFVVVLIALSRSTRYRLR